MWHIRIDTFANLLRYGHGLDCYCRGCRRRAACNLAALVAGWARPQAYRCWSPTLP